MRLKLYETRINREHPNTAAKCHRPGKIRVYPLATPPRSLWFKFTLSFRVLGVFRGFCCLYVSLSLFRLNPPHHLQSSETQTSLIELYTSEGCSSCPPAETWSSRLKESPGLWKEFVPVAFPCGLLGLPRLARPWRASCFRPTTHLREVWRSDSIYTPGFCLMGRNGVIGQDARTGQNPLA